jgi:acyl-CoA thioesterase
MPMKKQKGVFDYIKHDRFAMHSGIEMLEITAESAKAKLTVNEYHLNGVNIVHGGALFTLADLVFGALGYVHDQNAVSINASISYFKAVNEGTLIAEGRLTTLTPKLGSYTVHVSDEKGDIVAVFQGLGYRRQKGSSQYG